MLQLLLQAKLCCLYMQGQTASSSVGMFARTGPGALTPSPHHAALGSSSANTSSSSISSLRQGRYVSHETAHQASSSSNSGTAAVAQAKGSYAGNIRQEVNGSSSSGKNVPSRGNSSGSLAARRQTGELNVQVPAGGGGSFISGLNGGPVASGGGGANAPGPPAGACSNSSTGRPLTAKGRSRADLLTPQATCSQSLSMTLNSTLTPAGVNLDPQSWSTFLQIPSTGGTNWAPGPGEAASGAALAHGWDSTSSLSCAGEAATGGGHGEVGSAGVGHTTTNQGAAATPASAGPVPPCSAAAANVPQQGSVSPFTTPIGNSAAAATGAGAAPAAGTSHSPGGAMRALSHQMLQDLGLHQAPIRVSRESTGYSPSPGGGAASGSAVTGSYANSHTGGMASQRQASTSQTAGQSLMAQGHSVRSSWGGVGAPAVGGSSVILQPSSPGAPHIGSPTAPLQRRGSEPAPAAGAPAGIGSVPHEAFMNMGGGLVRNSIGSPVGASPPGPLHAGLLRPPYTGHAMLQAYSQQQQLQQQQYQQHSSRPQQQAVPVQRVEAAASGMNSSSSTGQPGAVATAHLQAAAAGAGPWLSPDQDAAGTSAAASAVYSPGVVRNAAQSSPGNLSPGPPSSGTGFSR